MIYTFNQYYLTAHLTRKAAHDIYLAYAAHTPEHKVLLKIYDPQCRYPDSTLEDFHAHAQKFKRLSHPHLAPVLDIGIEEGKPYVVSNYFPAGSLRQQLERIAPDHMLLDTVLALVSEVGNALSYAHSQQLVHQRVKPENVFLNVQGQAILTDFSLRELIKEPVQEGQPDDRVISYLASEQLAGSATAASDQYALACLLYELLTGKLPFTTQDLLYLWQRYTIPSPTPPSQYVATLPKQLEHAILKALSKKPEDRYADVEAFLAALKEVVRPDPPTFPFKHIIPLTGKQAAVRPAQAAVRPAQAAAPAQPAVRKATVQAPTWTKPVTPPQPAAPAQPVTSPQPMKPAPPAAPNEPERDHLTTERSQPTLSKEEAVLQIPFGNEEKIEPFPSSNEEKTIEPASWAGRGEATEPIAEIDEAGQMEPAPRAGKGEVTEPITEIDKGEIIESASWAGKGEITEPIAEIDKAEQVEFTEWVDKEEESEQPLLSGKEEENGISPSSFMKRFSRIQKAALRNRVIPGQKGQKWWEHSSELTKLPASAKGVRPASVQAPSVSPAAPPAPAPVPRPVSKNTRADQLQSDVESLPASGLSASEVSAQELPEEHKFQLNKRLYILLSVAVIFIVMSLFFAHSNGSIANAMKTAQTSTTVAGPNTSSTAGTSGSGQSTSELQTASGPGSVTLPTPISTFATGPTPTPTSASVTTPRPTPASASVTMPGSTPTPGQAPTPTPTSAPATTPRSTPTSEPTPTPQPAPTPTPEPKPTPTPDVPAWRADDTNPPLYNPGDEVSYKGHIYKCLRQVWGESLWAPDAPGMSGDYWQQIS